MVSKSPKTTVTHKKYSGNYHVVHLVNGEHGSLALHPHEHTKIKSLKNNAHLKFKGEDGTHYIAKRNGENVHITDKDNITGVHYEFPHSELNENLEESKRPSSKPKNLAKAALMSPIFRQKEHGKSNKHYDRKKEKKVDLREKILDRIEENTVVYNNTPENRKNLGVDKIPEYVKGDNSSKYITHDLKKGEFRYHNQLPTGKKIRK